MPIEHLLLPDRQTRSIERLERACAWSGLQVHRLAANPDLQLPAGSVLGNSAVHGDPHFCRRVASLLGARVLEPSDDFLVRLPYDYVRRRVTLTELREVHARLTEPNFIKPVNDKFFPAKIYADASELPTDEKLAATSVLISDPVQWRWEYRMFVRDRSVRASSVYDPTHHRVNERENDRQALDFAERVISDGRVSLPQSIVLDVGWIEGAGCAVVEANAAVMSNIYVCDPLAVISVLECGIERLPPNLLGQPYIGFPDA